MKAYQHHQFDAAPGGHEHEPLHLCILQNRSELLPHRQASGQCFWRRDNTLSLGGPAYFRTPRGKRSRARDASVRTRGRSVYADAGDAAAKEWGVRRDKRTKQPLTPEDRRELREFKGFLEDVAAGKPKFQAYAERYGVTVFDATKGSAP